MEELNLSTEVLDWAAKSIGESLESLASSIARRTSVRERIMRGELTVAQAEKVAQKTRVPFGLLFLDFPPTLNRPAIPDLRQTDTPDPLSRDFFDVLADVLGKQEWYIDYLKSVDASPLPFVGKFKFAERPKADTIANDIRRVIGLTDDTRRVNGTPQTYFTAISAKIEETGILVMKNGVVKSNTRRALAEREFRGFALVHPLAPIIFVNGRDAGVAAVFTLIHELAHIWLGESGVSDVFGPRSQALERLCNQIAADLLVPEAKFVPEWTRTPDLFALAQHFRVSRFVVGIRAVQLGLLSQDKFHELIATPLPARRERTGGGDGLKNISVRNSKRLTQALTKSALHGRTLIRDAAKLLNVKPETVMKLARPAPSESRRG